MKGYLAEGAAEIIDAPIGEPLRVTAARLATDARAAVVVERSGDGLEALALTPWLAVLAFGGAILLAVHRLRWSRLPVLLTGLAFGFALLLPEIGHSLAHRHAASPSAPNAIVGVQHGNVAWADSHSAGTHPHFDLQTAPPAKVSSGPILAARTAVELWVHLAEPSRPSLPARGRVAPAGRFHGPPSPSRAPPRS